MTSEFIIFVSALTLGIDIILYLISIILCMVLTSKVYDLDNRLNQLEMQVWQSNAILSDIYTDKINPKHLENLDI